MLAVAVMALVQPLSVQAQNTQEGPTLKTEMQYLHKVLDINFIYDSSLDLDIPYHGRSMAELTEGRRDGASGTDRAFLDECLRTLFKGTDIAFEINRKYVVLTKDGSRKAPGDYTILIEEQKDTIEESLITAFVRRQKNATQTGLMRLDRRKIDKGFSFMSSADLIKKLQTLPGVSGGTELFSGLHVHGGDGYDNLYMMDGIPMYQAGHLAGLFSAFNTDVIETADFYKSGFPARYGGRLSSVVDVRTKEGDFDEYHGKFSIGLMDSRFQLEGPIVKGKTSFNIGLRSSWLDAVSIPTFMIINSVVRSSGEKYNGHYRFWDANAKLTHRFAPENTLSLNFYMGRDNLGFRIEGEEADEWGNDFESNRLDMDWGNMVTSLNWDVKVGEGLYADVSLFHSQNRSSYDAVSVSDSRHSDGSRYYDEAYEFNIGQVDDFGGKADFDWYPSDSHHIRFGSKIQGHMYTPERGVDIYTERVGKKDGLHYLSGRSYGSFEPSVYVEDEMKLAEWLEANVGLRYVMSLSEGKAWHSLEPRAALSFRLSRMLSLRASYTEMSQFQHYVASTYIDLPFNMWMPSTAGIRPSRARQAAGGVYMDLPHGMSLNLEGWYKTMDNIYEYGGTDASLFPSLLEWERSFCSGKGRSWGASADFSWRTEKTDINASYTLSWNFRRFDAFWHDWYPDRNDHRHRVSITASHRFSKRFDAYAGWNWRKGSRMTVYSHVDPENKNLYYSSPNNMQLDDYHRLDIGFNFRKTTRRGNESIWNLSVYNAYCHMNPFFAEVYRYKISHVVNDEVVSSEDRPKGRITGIIPIVPSFSYTLKF